MDKTALLAPVRDDYGPEHAPHLPRAPLDGEQFACFARQRRRGVAILVFAVSLGSLYGIWAVFSKSWVWFPLALSLLILVPWSVCTLVLTMIRPSVNPGAHDAAFCATSEDHAQVDVFLPVCGEDLDVLTNTFEHVAALAWRGWVQVYVLDDSHTPAVRALARAYHFNYLARPNRGAFKKAGNLNHALEHSRGQYIVVFDADFAPAPGFLAHVIPYFADPRVGIVQTAQYFDTGRRGTANWMARYAGAIQDSFFTWVQPHRDTIGSALCVGTNVAYRRAALEAADGWTKIEGGEDVITGIAVMTHGYRVAYVPLNLAKGLCPDTFRATVNQQYRWCKSSLDLVYPPTRKNVIWQVFRGCKMTLVQRVSYLTGTLYYLQSILVLMIAVTPSLVMLWVYPYQIGPGNYLPILPAMAGMLAMPAMIRGWRPQMLRLVMIYSVAHLLAGVDTLLGRSAAWVPSGAGKHRNLTPLFASIILRTWVVVTQGAAWIALAYDVPVYKLPAYWLPLLFAAFQTVVLFPLLLPRHGVGNPGEQTTPEWSETVVLPAGGDQARPAAAR
jgi:cellulose synthase (UDP-forming)